MSDEQYETGEENLSNSDEQYEKYKEQIDDIRSMVTNAIAETMDLYGAPPSVGRIYGAMYFHENPSTLDDLREELDMSKAAMSTGVKRLLENKMVKRVYKKKQRKDLYQAETDLFKTFISFFTKRWEYELDVNLDAIKDAEPYFKELLNDEELPEALRESVEDDLQKIQQAREYYHFLQELIMLFRTEEIFDMMNEYRQERRFGRNMND
ncbi:DNA-binding transcriptional regulator GbsR (MarR family) [Salsuginibacillus halophilus]|uniref:HTH-type transcriptional regulator n=1 Tax=Salsuginibacillus halophilus TaxID=517424 RepID=A0A2P8HBD9_9BACI|nr:GbsR/MarR family transcriptional regulator [Salsuginibacillus halophilus]PSL43540.1 DNA-binding transcriptional regulator GbsR (MarR family) [Salsuginibacillus halophilus]